MCQFEPALGPSIRSGVHLQCLMTTFFPASMLGVRKTLPNNWSRVRRVGLTQGSGFQHGSGG